MPAVLRMMKAIFSGRGMHRRHHEVALVLAVVVVGHDHDLAAGKGRDRRFDTPVLFGHNQRLVSERGGNGHPGPSPICPR